MTIVTAPNRWYEVSQPEFTMRPGTTALATTVPSDVAVMNTPAAKPRAPGRNQAATGLSPAEKSAPANRPSAARIASPTPIEVVEPNNIISPPATSDVTPSVSRPPSQSLQNPLAAFATT